MTDWYAEHPQIVDKIVATMGIEHLGQREYIEQGDDFVQSGLPEPTLVFAQDNDFLIEEAIKAVKHLDVPRTMVSVAPARRARQLVGHERCLGEEKLSGLRYEHAHERLLVDPRAARDV